MTIYICDKCGKSLKYKELVRIAYTVRTGKQIIDENFLNSETMFKDFCRECAVNFIGQDTINDKVSRTIERREKRMQKLKSEVSE